MTSKRREPGKWPDPDKPHPVSIEAVRWALDWAPGVPTSLVSTLVALARFANDDGLCWPSIGKLMHCTRKTTRSQIIRDLQKLVELGLIQRRPEDQWHNEHLDADRRPTVYRLPAGQRGTKRAPMERGSTDATPYEVAPMRPRPENEVAPVLPRDGNEVAPVRQRGRMGAPNGVAPMRQRGRMGATQSSTDQRTDQSTSSARRERALARIVEATNATTDEAELILKQIEADSRQPIDRIDAYVANTPEDDLRRFLDDVRGTVDRTQRGAFLAQISGLPDCAHGFAGGHVAMPGTDWYACPIARRNAAPADTSTTKDADGPTRANGVEFIRQLRQGHATE